MPPPGPTLRPGFDRAGSPCVGLHIWIDGMIHWRAGQVAGSSTDTFDPSARHEPHQHHRRPRIAHPTALRAAPPRQNPALSRTAPAWCKCPAMPPNCGHASKCCCPKSRRARPTANEAGNCPTPGYARWPRQACSPCASPPARRARGHGARPVRAAAGHCRRRLQHRASPAPRLWLCRKPAGGR